MLKRNMLLAEALTKGIFKFISPSFFRFPILTQYHDHFLHSINQWNHTVSPAGLGWSSILEIQNLQSS